MKTKRMLDLKRKLAVIIAGVAVGWMAWQAGGLCAAQTPVPALPPGVSEVVKLAQAKMTDDVILTYVRNSNITCTLSADQIVYLSGQGVSQNVISALMQSTPAVGSGPAPAPAVSAPAPAPTAPPSGPPGPPPGAGMPAGPTVAMAPTVGPAPVVAAEPPPATFDSFHAQLAPYGNWIQVAGYGWCWRPADAMANPLWRPYGDRGHWVYTENGWFWQSEYPWGDITFHYGRWNFDPGLGWMWVPDYTWGPAWVCWRQSEGVCGWAPLPPSARFVAGVGLTFNGRVGLELDFGIRPEHFMFVDYGHFWDHDLHRFYLPRERALVVFRGSHVYNNFRFDHGRVIHEGIGHERIATFTHRRVEVEVVQRGHVVERRVEIGGGPRDRVVERKVEVSAGPRDRVVEKKVEVNVRPGGRVVEKTTTTTTVESRSGGRGRPGDRPADRSDDKDKGKKDH